MTGTLVYALVVIVVNVKILYSTYTHTFLSVIINLLSIGSFFVIFYMENVVYFVPQLYQIFSHAVRVPAFYFLILFFVLFTISTEKIMYHTGEYYKDIKEQKKKEQEQKIMHARKQLESGIVRHTIKHKGFAYEADAAPQLSKINHKHHKVEVIKEEQEDFSEESLEE